jgi:hypothetical protein
MALAFPDLLPSEGIENVVRQLSIGVYKGTLAGHITLTGRSPQLMSLDPGGAARNVTLPAPADSKDRWFLIVNHADAAEAITVLTAGPATVIVISQNEAGIVFCDGAAWDGFQISGALT